VVVIFVLIVMLAAVIAAGIVVFRMSASFSRRQRIVLFVLVALAATYVLPRLFYTAMQGYRVGVEMRERQGR